VGARLVVCSLVLAVIAAKWFAVLTAFGDAPLPASYKSYTALLVLLMVLGITLRGERVARWVAASAGHPARLMALSFGLTSLLGAFLLALPFSVRRASDVSLLDSLFMSMSAVCVTGLATVNIADTYSFVGQLVICALIQIGGLGIMVLTAAVTMLAGRRLDVKSTAVLAEMVDARSLADLRRTVLMIVGYSLAFEAVGAAILYTQFSGVAEIERTGGEAGGLAGAGGPLWAAIFHAVSAFNNAGMSVFRDGLAPVAGSPLTCQTVVLLVVLGGIGFPVIHELMLRAMTRLRGQRPVRITLHTRLALATTAMLLGGMALAYLALESSASFQKLGFFDRLNAAIFQSASARTAGFNVVDIGLMRPATLLLTCFAMFVGGSPGATAGGIKTTTLAVLFAAFRGELRRVRARLFDRAVPDPVVQRAMGVAFLSTSLVVAIVFLLLLTEKHPPLAILFETVSAFSTTGLSTGITPLLSAPGKLLIVGTMLIGRVGPLTMALALSAGARPPAYELPEERVMIG
jgi:trk system potassium uptake protein TrkH